MVLFFSVIGNPTFVKQWRNNYETIQHKRTPRAPRLGGGDKRREARADTMHRPG